MWEKHKINVKVAAQTLSASVADVLDFLCDEMAHPGFMESEATSEFIKRMDLAFDLMNSCQSLSKGIKQPVTHPYFKRYWAKACHNLTDYIIRNSIEPSKTGNCINFEDAFRESQGLLDFSWKRKQKPIDLVDSSASDTFSISAERMLIENLQLLSRRVDWFFHLLQY